MFDDELWDNFDNVFDDSEDIDGFSDDFDNDSYLDDNFDDLDFDDLDYKSKDSLDMLDEKPLKVDDGYNKNAIEVHISKQLTSQKILLLIDTYPSLKRITCPKSIYDRISTKYLDALNELGISVEIKYNWGKKKYSEEDVDEVIKLINEGNSPDKVAEILNIPLNRVNYFKSKYHDKVVVSFRKKKYGDDLKEEIILMKTNGFSCQEISKLKSIPLRSVYYIINKK